MPSHILSRVSPAYEAPSEFGHAFSANRTFDYDELPDDVANEARAAAEQIRTQTAAARIAFIEIGRTLLRMRERIDHGRFLLWAHSQLGMQPRTVQRFMRAAEFVDSQPGRVSLTRLTRDALYALTAPSVPAPVREDIVAAIEHGETITPTDIRQRISAACSKRDAPKHVQRPVRRPADEAAIAGMEGLEDEPESDSAIGHDSSDDAPQTAQPENTPDVSLFARLASELTRHTRYDALDALDRMEAATFAQHFRTAIEAAVDEEQCSHVAPGTLAPIESESEDEPAPLPTRRLQ